MKLQTIKQNGQDAFVVVPIAEWDTLMARLEERDDIADAKAQLAKIQAGEETLPTEIVARLTSGEAPLKVWREYRGYTLRALAAEIGISSAAVSKIETGKSRPTVDTLGKLAAALGCDMEDLA
ncbi:MAG: XRE family transcriptional regulator [Gallionellales bacterium RIFCSPLOWO2_12_FULL_59_22]|nr:MAG: XRE family transcriptional regulator [Gallionellales bacterium RIFCSPLOWO2_02_FULL_59_110]OGT12529.1 MAG: XRE family transcriptional regulator [Gallionellales bacterium RIFCSPLOWO2_12_FULL_59_22]